MSGKRFARRSIIIDDDEEDKYYNFKVLLPNGTTVPLSLVNPDPEMAMAEFVKLLREEYDKSRKDCLLLSKRTPIDWKLGGKFTICVSTGAEMKGKVNFAAFTPNVCHIIQLDDGSGVVSHTYENMWDLTPDPDLLEELPESYDFDTALADLIDNSLQAVWPCREGDKKLIRVDISADRISVFDTGSGMDSSEGNSITKWGKIGSSFHRSQKGSAVGGKPPYLKPYFGMFGYGGPYACMFLGRRTLVSSKTKESSKVFTLEFKKEAFIDNRSILGKQWKTGGGMRDMSDEEKKLAPHGSFTKVEIFESDFDISKLYQLQCRLKDVYFPYIQCDELSKTGKTECPVDFEVNGDNLAMLMGGEVAITHLNSKGRVFSFEIRFTQTGEIKQGTSEVANARLKCAYFPVVEGKESIEKILETLEEEGCKVSENFQTFGRVSVRRLGRLLPEVRWDSIPFMKRGTIASTLQKSSQRVKCFVDLDAGFNPTPSKTDLASKNCFAMALRNFGSKLGEKDTADVKIEIHNDGVPISLTQLEHKYQEWILEMHDTHDEEATSGVDDAVLILGPLDKKLGISRDAARVHKLVKRKGKSWKRGQKIKILKGAYAGVHHTNLYATIDYFVMEGFEDETGGDTWILCRPINLHENQGCTLSIIDGISSLEVRGSLRLPITIIDQNKCLPAGPDEWKSKIERQKEKAPSKIELLDEIDCDELDIDDAELPVGETVYAGQPPPQQIVAVVRPALFTSSKSSKKLEQRHIVKMDGKEMVMTVDLVGANMKSSGKNLKNVCSQRSHPTSRKGISGLYIFSLGDKYATLFKKAGTYNFSFSIGDSIKCEKKVVVRPSPEVASWKLVDDLGSCDVRVGSSFPPVRVACFDDYGNRLKFPSVPSLEVKLEANPGFHVAIDNVEADLVSNGSVLIIKDMLVETNELDQIRPHYEANLEIRAKDEPFSVLVPCKVNPGPLKRVAVNNPQALENLLPGSTAEDLILEMFDGYNNHVAEGTDFLLHTDGYSIEDRMGVNRKVDGNGCCDLSDILKVTKGYGKSVSLSVLSGAEEIFKIESQTGKRELNLVTELPESCTAGSQLTNLVFEVTDPDGFMDTNIHHDEKSGRFHTLSIASDSSSIQSAVRYAFVHGSCKVPTLSLPENEGVLSFRVFHSRYNELHVDVEIPLISAPTFERDDIGCSTPSSGRASTPNPGYSGPASTPNPRLTPTPSFEFEQTPCSQFGGPDIRESPWVHSSQTGLMDMEQYTESLREKLDTYSARKAEGDGRLVSLEAEKEKAELELIDLQATLQPISVAFPEYLSTRESVMKQIEEHHDTAASVFCGLYKKCPPPQTRLLSRKPGKGVFGIVALLGSVATTSLSRVLSEYLGKDTMLALVCKTTQCGPNSPVYEKIQSEAAKLNQTISHRFIIKSLDAFRPFGGGLVKNDPQRKLAVDNQYLPNGDPIPGFIGYAVNMINLGEEELEVISSSGYSLRETLFYGLFGDLQVYETGKHLEEALEYINGENAISLDGVIYKDNGFIVPGCCEPEIHFPITVTENDEKTLVKLEITKAKKRKAEKMMAEESDSLRKLTKKMKKTNEHYQKLKARLRTDS